MKYLVTSILLFSCLTAFCGEDKGRTCRIIFPDRPHTAPRVAYLFDGERSHEVDLPSNNFTAPIKLPTGELILVLSPDPVPANGKLPPEAPVAQIATGISDFYLILVSDPENEIMPARILPVDQGSERPGAGQTLWMNLTEHRILGTLGDQSLELPAGECVVADAPLPASGYFKAEFSYQPKSEGETFPVMRKSWWFDDASTNLGFVIESGGRLPKIFTFRDRRVAVVEEPED